MGKPNEKSIEEFQDPEIREKLRDYYLSPSDHSSNEKSLEQDERDIAILLGNNFHPDSNTAADVFADELLEVARPYLNVPSLAREMGNRNDLVKEANTFQSDLQSLATNLEHMSPGVLFDQHGVATIINEMRSLASRFEHASKNLKKYGRRLRPQEIIKSSARELAVQVITVLSSHNVKITASSSSIEKGLQGYQSVSVKILASINQAVGFPHAFHTMRDLIDDLKKNELKYQFEGINKKNQ
jgi:hypothetical protein